MLKKSQDLEPTLVFEQVILKPDPGNSQELYLGSLAALGVDIKAHDVRFVEDNWESPVWMMRTYPWLSSSFMLGFPHFDYWVAAR
jgi:glycyl-tRNA synthetase